MKKMRAIFNGVMVAAMGLFLLSGCGDSDNDTSTTVSGKVIQSAVSGATVFLDINGNRTLDSGEPSTTTGSDGSYSLNIPDGTEGVLCSTGGTLENGEAALPMLAPRNAKNITAITTLVALQPGLKAEIGSDWDTDPYNETMSSKAIQLKYVTESYLKQFQKLGKTTAQQMSAATLLARGLNTHGVELASDSNLKAVAYSALKAVVGLGDNNPSNSLTAMETLVLNNAKTAVDAVVDAIDETTASKSTITTIDNSVNRTGLAYDLVNQVMPVPNDVAWAKTSGKVVLDTSSVTDTSQKTLYEAINKLELSGLSPNTPIAIPLSNKQALNTDDFASNIIMFSINGTTFTPYTKFYSVQEDNFIKIYPLGPLASGTKYLVLLKTGIHISGSTTDTIAKNPVFELLKSDDALDDTNLETLRQSYSQIFAGLALAGIAEDDILTLFTFTTADKTISLTDFSQIAAAIEAQSTDNMTISGLPYSAITAEYGTFNGSDANANSLGDNIEGLAATTTVDSDSFTSVKVETLASTKTSEDVPYVIYNKDKYNGTVVVFQHGFTGYKEQAYAFALKHPSFAVIAMDLPLHGDRDATPDDDTDSGSTYLTSNMGQDRINLYQSYFDMSIFINAIKQGKFDINGDGSNDAPSKIFFTGISLGSITGSIVAKYNLPYLDKVVLNVGGGNFAAIFDTAKNKLLTSILDGFKLTKNTTSYFVTMGVLQLLLDPADPAYLVDSSIGAKTMFENSYMDTIVSNVGNRILASVADAGTSVDVKDFTADLTQYAPYTDTVFWFGGGTPSGNASANWVPHTLLYPVGDNYENGAFKSTYYPEASSYFDYDYITAGYASVNDLIDNYFNN